MQTPMRRSSVVALSAALVGATILFTVWFGSFSRFHVVEDYLPTDSGPGRAITRLFPQEQMLLGFGAALLALALAIVVVGLFLRDRGTTSNADEA